MARTRVVTTLGPATDDEARLAALLDAGVDIVRLNFSHGSHEEHGRRIAMVRKIAGDRPVAILQDLGGPKLRLQHAVSGQVGDVVDLALPASVRVGDPVLLADGIMQLQVVAPGRARIIVGGAIPAGKGVNLPSSSLDMPALTDKDRRDLAFGVEQGVDLVALSFVGGPEDVLEARRESAGIPVIAKVERAKAVERLDDIVDVADGVMVARGDLGVEIPIEKVPLTQKRLIRLANRAAKPVITATQMLRSMVQSTLPTRAEASDVANAVFDGTDAVMLSEETAIGEHPVEAVAMMQRILHEAERALESRPHDDGDTPPEQLARGACMLAEGLRAAAIVIATNSGFTVRHVARHRSAIPIVALTWDEKVRRQLSLVWGVQALRARRFADADALFTGFREPVRAAGLVPVGAPVVVIAGWPLSETGMTNLLHVTTA
jgi:pyruvate kinase